MTLIRLIDPRLPTPIKFIRQYKAKKVIYDVEMESVSASQAIREAYGLFWRKKSGRKLPDQLRGITFSNATTFSTRVRVRLLKELCRRHQAANPSVSCFVTSYLPRPELKIRERRGPVTSLTYTQAIQSLAHPLTIDFLQELFLYAKTNLPEKEVIDRFLVLRPDLLSGPQGSQQLEPMSVDESAPQSAPATSGSANTPPAAAAAGSQPLSAPPVPSIPAVPGLVGTNVATAVPSTSPPGLVRSLSNPTYATLTPVQLTPPANLSNQLLLAIQGTESAPSASDETTLPKRNRNRFAKKSTPYPVPM